jgi:hypothetical protein
MGAPEGIAGVVRTITPIELEARFPKLGGGNYKRASQATARYNCLAFACGDDRRWWEPRPGGRFYWPPDAQRDTSLAAVTRIFTADGYSETEDRNIESGYLKAAIYVELEDLDTYSHVALSDGLVWKSKLGKGQDIEHASLDLLEGNQKDEYGIVAAILRKAIQ